MSDKPISNLPLTANAGPDDLLLVSKKDGDLYVSYSIAKENLYNSNDFLSANESFLSSTVALSDINDNEIADYVKNDTIANDDTAGLVKTGYQTTGKNYAVQLSDAKMYVNVPWEGGSAADVNVDDKTIKKYDDNTIYVNDLMIASRDFVNSSIQNIAAFYITDSEGLPFETYAQLSSTTSADMYCGGKQWTPQRNDYCIVRQDESKIEKGGHWTINGQYKLYYKGFNDNIFWWIGGNKNLRYRKTDGYISIYSGGDSFIDKGLPSGLNPENGDDIPEFQRDEDEAKYVFTKQGANALPTSRYIYNPGVSAVSSEYDSSKWEFLYTINDSGFTADQLNALNSGITREKTSQIADIAALVALLQLNGFGLSTITGTDESGQQHTYEILMKEK